MAPPNRWTPEWAVHPGEILADWMAERHVGLTRLAAAMGVSTEDVTRILTGESDLTPEIAAKLAVETHIVEETWMNLQTMFDDYRRRKADEAAVDASPEGERRGVDTDE